MKPLLFVIFLCLSWASSVSAQSSYSKKHLRASTIDRVNSERQIRELKTGILLVRLRTRQPLIDALTKRNRLEEAKQVIANQRLVNREIITAFSTYFSFCPVYFFRSTYSEQVKNGKLDQVLFLNEEAIEDSTITPPSLPFFIAEFTLVERDTATFASRTYWAETENGLEKRTRYEGGGNFGFEALVFKSATFYQLRRPFPYYARTLQSLPVFRRSYKRVIQIADEELDYYYRKVY